jgi:hypothetical protein
MYQFWLLMTGIYYFAMAPIKLRLRQHIGEETTNSKPPGPIIMIRQSEALNICYIIFSTLFYAGTVFLRHSPAIANWAIMLSQNHFGSHYNTPCLFCLQFFLEVYVKLHFAHWFGCVFSSTPPPISKLPLPLPPRALSRKKNQRFTPSRTCPWHKFQ